MDLRFEGASALVTGGSSGLGRASAVALAREGADVAVCARNADRLESARTAVEDAGEGDVLALQGDVTDDQGDVSRLVEETASTFGGLNHLVFSTGGPKPGPVLETDERDWYVTYDLLVMGLVRFVWQAHDHLAADGGSVTVVSCTEAYEAVERRALSGTIRRAATGLVKTLSRELAPAVRVNAVLAGPHDTPYFEGVLDADVEDGGHDSRTDALRDVRNGIPLERVGDPGEFGDVVAFLTSERARFVTGTAVPVDGGTLRT